jgi:hypothetical protein
MADGTQPTFSEKETYTAQELYEILSAVESRTRTDLMYHCRRAAEEIENDLKTEEDSSIKDEMAAHAASLRSIQSLANRAEEDLKDLDK